MDIGIVGSGKIGANAARLFTGAGHRVAISNSRGPETLGDLVSELGAYARAVTVGEAAGFGEVVFEAIPFGRYEELPPGRLEGRILIDASNYYPGRDGEIALGGLGSSEVIARHLPGARVVKAFNTMYYETLRTGAGREDRLVLFVAGDDAEAKAVVSRLIEEIGFAPVEVGTLADGCKQEPGSPIYNVPMTEDEAREALAALG